MRSRPSAALAALLAAVVLAGCGSTQWAGSASIGGATSTPVAPIAPAAAAAGGTTVVTGPQGGYVSVNVSGGVANFFYWLTGAGIYAAMLMDEYQHNNGGGALLPLPMRENRTVAELDCTKPIPEELIGNIKCK